MGPGTERPRTASYKTLRPKLLIESLLDVGNLLAFLRGVGLQDGLGLLKLNIRGFQLPDLLLQLVDVLTLGSEFVEQCAIVFGA